MTKRQTRLFFVGGTTLFAIVFVAADHRQPPAVRAADARGDAHAGRSWPGKHVWHRKDCINCHTLLGEGAYFAPDLTKIAQQRGEPYLRQFLKDPSRFYSEEQHGRLMPNPNLSDQEAGDVIAFLTWVSNIDNNNWPPRPIRGECGTPQDITLGTAGAGGRLRTIPLRSVRRFSAVAAGLLQLPFDAARRADRRTVARGTRRPRGRDDPQDPRTTPARHTRRKSTSASRSCIRAPTWCPGPTFSAGGQSIMPAIYQTR